MKQELQNVLVQRKRSNRLKTDNMLPVPWVEYTDTYNKAFETINPDQIINLRISPGNIFDSKDVTSDMHREAYQNANIFEYPGDNRKVILNLYHQWYHLILDTMVYVYQAWLDDPKTQFVFVEDLNHSDYWKNHLFPFFLKFLDHLGITDFDVIPRESASKIGIIKTKNAYYKKLAFGTDLYFMCNEYIRSMYPLDDKEPFRKAYISRRKNYVKPQEDDGFVDQKTFDVSRVGNEEKVEEYLKSFGWEIVYPEDFTTIDEQVAYMREVKYLMGASSAGLINACFMKPGGTVIELLTTIEMWDKTGPLNTQFHVLYTVMCWALSQLHVSIPNVKNEEALFDFIEKNQYARQIVQNT